MEKLAFMSDYMEGAHPAIMKKLMETNLEHTPGYGLDKYSEEAKDRVKKACECPDADVYFLTGGTQTNMTVIDSALLPFQGVICADSGHIAVHEAGAIEYTGHKVLTLKGSLGKISAKQVNDYVADYYKDENWDHMVMPGMVYISQPTEYGTMYSLSELEDLSCVCKKHNIKLYVDGARLAYALACKNNNVTLSDLARLTDVFYIGGTKCGAMIGEAVVIPHKDSITQFFTQIKRHGALLAKGRIAAIQFGELFNDNLYFKVGKNAMDQAERIKKALVENGFEMFFEPEKMTNQVFFIVDEDQLKKISKTVDYGFFSTYPNNRSVIRFATSWATEPKDVDRLIEVIKSINS